MEVTVQGAGSVRGSQCRVHRPLVYLSAGSLCRGLRVDLSAVCRVRACISVRGLCGGSERARLSAGSARERRSLWRSQWRSMTTPRIPGGTCGGVPVAVPVEVPQRPSGAKRPSYWCAQAVRPGGTIRVRPAGTTTPFRVQGMNTWYDGTSWLASMFQSLAFCLSHDAVGTPFAWRECARARMCVWVRVDVGGCVYACVCVRACA